MNIIEYSDNTAQPYEVVFARNLTRDEAVKKLIEIFDAGFNELLDWSERKVLTKEIFDTKTVKGIVVKEYDENGVVREWERSYDFENNIYYGMFNDLGINEYYNESLIFTDTNKIDFESFVREGYKSPIGKLKTSLER